MLVKEKKEWAGERESWGKEREKLMAEKETLELTIADMGRELTAVKTSAAKERDVLRDSLSKERDSGVCSCHVRWD